MSAFKTLIGNNIETAATWLRKGELVGIPTETVYGLAANALDPKAVVKIFEAKERPFFDPLIVHFSSINRVFDFIIDFPSALQEIAEQYWPGPLTILLLKNELIPDIVTSGLPTVGVRVPAQATCNALLKELDFPLAAPSANPFGYISPTQPQHVYDQLNGKIPYILDGGPCTVGIESTIIGMEEDCIVVYRPGGLPIETIHDFGFPVRRAENPIALPDAPGMFKSHYSPRKPLIFGDQFRPESGMNIAIITFDQVLKDFPAENQFLLSPGSNLLEAAKNLFSIMRILDNSDFDIIWALPFPNHGLGVAINDRLKRAAHLKD